MGFLMWYVCYVWADGWACCTGCSCNWWRDVRCNVFGHHQSLVLYRGFTCDSCLDGLYIFDWACCVLCMGLSDTRILWHVPIVACGMCLAQYPKNRCIANTKRNGQVSEVQPDCLEPGRGSLVVLIIQGLYGQYTIESYSSYVCSIPLGLFVFVMFFWRHNLCAPWRMEFCKCVGTMHTQ